MAPSFVEGGQGIRRALVALKEKLSGSLSAQIEISWIGLIKPRSNGQVRLAFGGPL